MLRVREVECEGVWFELNKDDKHSWSCLSNFFIGSSEGQIILLELFFTFITDFGDWEYAGVPWLDDLVFFSLDMVDDVFSSDLLHSESTMCKLLYWTHALESGLCGPLLGPVMTFDEVVGCFLEDGTLVACVWILVATGRLECNTWTYEFEICWSGPTRWHSSQ